MTKLDVSLNGRTVKVELDWLPQDGNRMIVEVEGRQIPVFFSDSGTTRDEPEWLIVDGRPLEITFDSCLKWICANGCVYPLEIRDLEAIETYPQADDGRVQAPIPGLITAIMVEEGMPVKTGQTLLILEAMKMENEIRSPIAGIVEAVQVSTGQNVSSKQLLVKVVKS